MDDYIESLECFSIWDVLSCTCCVVGALEERCGQSGIRAAALGSEELMRTGALISMECLLFPITCAVRCVILRAVNEWRFLAFFFPSTRLWTPALPLQLTAALDPEHGAAAGEHGSVLGPGVSVGLSISSSCLAVSFNYTNNTTYSTHHTCLNHSLKYCMIERTTQTNNTDS